MDFWAIYSAAFKEYRARKFDAALNHVAEVKKLVPELKKIHMLEAWIYFEQGEYLKAFNILIKLLPDFDLNSDYDKDLAAKSLNYLGLVCDLLALTTEALEFFYLASRLYEDKRKNSMAMSNAIYIANAPENFSAADFRKLYDEYKKILADIEPYPKKFYAHEKIRVGFISADFIGHPVMNWAFALITGLDKNLFETYCYSARRGGDFFTKKIREGVEVWRDISGLTDEAAAKLIREDEADILFDLSGHTAGNRLGVAAYRPASVQISGIGYVNSTGLDCFDYFLSDETCAGDENFFTEKLIKLPRSHICYTPLRTLKISDAPCVKNKFVTFGSFNQFCKVSDLILSIWKKILDAVPGSRLILKTKILGKEDGKKFVGERLKNFGFDLTRIDLRGYTANHLRDYADVDIALDTYPYTGGVTTCEALYMGVPVISLYGARHGTRFGLSILKNIGLEELAANSPEEYLKRAVMLADNPELISLLRKNLRGMMKKSALMDSKNYVHDVEAAFIKILRTERNF